MLLLFAITDLYVLAAAVLHAHPGYNKRGGAESAFQQVWGGG
jgi:hypothetical protein